MCPGGGGAVMPAKNQSQLGDSGAKGSSCWTLSCNRRFGGGRQSGGLAELVNASSEGGGVGDRLERRIGREGECWGGCDLQRHGGPADPRAICIGGDVRLDGQQRGVAGR